MICPIFAQNMCHKLPIGFYGQNMGKIWYINWSYFAQNMAHKMGNVFEYLQCRYLCRKMETVYAENRLQGRSDKCLADDIDTGFVTK